MGKEYLIDYLKFCVDRENGSFENLSEKSRLKETIGNIEKTLKDSADDLSVRAKKELNKMLNAAKAKLKVMV